MAEYNPQRVEEIQRFYGVMRENHKKIRERKSAYWTSHQQSHHEKYAASEEDKRRFEELEGHFIRGKELERRRKKVTLQQRLGVILLLLIGGIILIFSSLRLTGNAVSNLTQTAPGLLGVILFIAGILGVIFYMRRK